MLNSQPDPRPLAPLTSRLDASKLNLLSSDHSSKRCKSYEQRRSDAFLSNVFYVNVIDSNIQSHILRKSPQLPPGATRYELGDLWMSFGTLASSEPAQPASQSPPPPHTQNLTPQPAEGPSSVLNLNLEG